ncbi:hypothetical protein GGS20DRAFT_279697 [Poronia punctata]|nr:hypothetical protein GGS20DRAFT_279697 [Poronia punctata]
MASSVGPATLHDSLAGEMYDPDEVLPRNSPLLKPRVVKLDPSVSPPSVPIPIIDPTQGDVVLLQCMDDGRHPEISQQAGFSALDPSNSEDDYQSGSDSEGVMTDESEDEDGVRSNDMSPIPQLSRYTESRAGVSAPRPESVDLKSLASSALAAVAKSTDGEGFRGGKHETELPRRGSLTDSSINSAAMNRGRVMSMPSVQRPVLAPPPMSPYPLHGSPEIFSPQQQQTANQVLMHPNNVRSPTNPSAGSHGELAPIHIASPRSDSSSHEALPSIRTQLYEQLHGSPKDLAVRSGPQFPQSPPTGPSRLGSISGNHASSPVSPNETYRNTMPSPATTLHTMSPYSSKNLGGGHSQYSLVSDYGKLELSSINQVLTPPTDRIADRMSIDNVTNPQVGLFVCTHQGCNAQPFQTQYLLNSHANVHSSARPHYCPVKGCPRSEGGKGFKRKNEMIRHGLVHDSPGYVCPFCPEREHKYPRPDNLQRHVRVHHTDKDKDDPLLRDVLSQRPDGPNRGRRRRGVS